MPATCYLQILSTQRPFPFQVDENERTMFSVNFQAMSAQEVDDWERDLIRLLVSAPVAGIVYTFPDGRRSTDNTFIGPKAVIPTGAGPYVSILDTGGAAPFETHNGDKQEQLSAQLIIRGGSYYAARDLAIACWRALDGVRNTTVSS
jgi:hypothetical protein